VSTPRPLPNLLNPKLVLEPWIALFSKPRVLDELAALSTLVLRPSLLLLILPSDTLREILTYLIHAPLPKRPSRC
jgi:hypothetical protein